MTKPSQYSSKLQSVSTAPGQRWSGVQLTGLVLSSQGRQLWRRYGRGLGDRCCAGTSIRGQRRRHKVQPCIGGIGLLGDSLHRGFGGCWLVPRAVLVAIGAFRICLGLFDALPRLVVAEMANTPLDTPGTRSLLRSRGRVSRRAKKEDGVCTYEVACHMLIGRRLAHSVKCLGCNGMELSGRRACGSPNVCSKRTL